MFYWALAALVLLLGVVLFSYCKGTEKVKVDDARDQLLFHAEWAESRGEHGLAKQLRARANARS
jgi:hypothetical protein